MKFPNQQSDYIRIDKPNYISSPDFDENDIDFKINNLIKKEDFEKGTTDNIQNKVTPKDFVNRKILARRETILQYKHLEPNDDCIYKTNREIDVQVLNLQVKLKNEKTSEKDLEDPEVLEGLQKYVDSRHPRQKLGNKLIFLIIS